MIVLQIGKPIYESIIISFLNHLQIPILMLVVKLRSRHTNRQQVMGRDLSHRFTLHFLNPRILRFIMIANSILHIAQTHKLGLCEEWLDLYAFFIFNYRLLQLALLEKLIAPLPTRQRFLSGQQIFSLNTRLKLLINVMHLFLWRFLDLDKADMRFGGVSVG